MIILIKILVILMIMITKITEKPKNIVNFGQNIIFLGTITWWKKGPKNSGKGKPPPHFWAMPELKSFFLVRMSSLREVVFFGNIIWHIASDLGFEHFPEFQSIFLSFEYFSEFCLQKNAEIGLLGSHFF